MPPIGATSRRTGRTDVLEEVRAWAATPFTGLPAFRLAFGVALLVRPQLVGALPGAPPDRATPVVARLLGARHVVEAIVLYRHRSRPWLYGGAAVDAVHAATAVTLAAASRRRRPRALLNACSAGALAGANLLAARRCGSEGLGALRPRA